MLVSKFNYIQFTVCSVYVCMYMYIWHSLLFDLCIIYIIILHTYMHTYIKFYIEYILATIDIIIIIDGYNNSVDDVRSSGVCLLLLGLTFITFHSNCVLPF